MAWQREATQAGQGAVWHGLEGRGNAGSVRIGQAGLGKAWFVRARQRRRGVAGRGKAGRGEPRRGKAGKKPKRDVIMRPISQNSNLGKKQNGYCKKNRYI